MVTGRGITREGAMKKVVVLGAGLVGKDVARDLASAFEVTAMDIDADALERAFVDTDIATAAADLSDPGAVRELVAPFDLVVGALPGRFGHAALSAVIDAGKDVVDIAFFPEDPFTLDDAAKTKGVTAIVDFGVAPGMCHVFLGHHVATWHAVERFECLVGGLPVTRTWPFDYKAPFSPADVLEEYTRPARYVEHGVVVTRPALSDPERVEFEGVGTLEALNTDGLRTALVTTTVPNMKEKTLRYPGHGRLMEAIREAGFLSPDPIEVGGVTVRPLDVTSKLIFRQWALGDDEPEFTVMRVTVEGEPEAGVQETVVWDLLDRRDPETGTSSMARTTGYACTAAVHLVASGRYRRPGISAPEHVGAEEGALAFLLDYQRERGVVYERRSL
jgi:saccharopine dehydrogenase-like NADP-dependent oxidoreductase